MPAHGAPIDAVQRLVCVPHRTPPVALAPTVASCMPSGGLPATSCDGRVSPHGTTSRRATSTGLRHCSPWPPTLRLAIASTATVWTTTGVGPSTPRDPRTDTSSPTRCRTRQAL
jgi:hypothetical protein